jgi:hypothetical protein
MLDKSDNAMQTYENITSKAAKVPTQYLQTPRQAVNFQRAQAQLGTLSKNFKGGINTRRKYQKLMH